MTFDIKKFLAESRMLTENRPGSFDALKADLANSMLTEKRHYKKFVEHAKANKYSRARGSLRDFQVTQRESQRIGERLVNAIPEEER